MSNTLLILQTLQRQFLLLVAVMACSLTAFSQAQKQVTGTISNEKNEPLPSVTVVAKGTTVGTTTDADGHYAITMPQNSNILAFSFIGYESREITVGNQTTVNVTLQTNEASLKGVVVVGFGTQSRADVTTSISKLDNKVLENVPYSNAASALEGTIPGLRVLSSSGQPGATPRIILRGGTSINNPNGATPLYVIDGVIRSNMDDINSADIKSIQVLKDAAATAIYGARGSNGVIIIETKSGVAGKTRVDYKYDVTFSRTGKTYDLLDARDFVYYSRLGIMATGRVNPSFLSLLTGNTYPGGTGNDLTNQTVLSLQYLTPENQYKLKEGWMSMPDPLDSSKTLLFSGTDYQDYLFRTAVSQSHSVSVSGGNEKATFHLGLGYLNAQGTAIQTNYKRFSFDFSGDMNVTDKIKVFGKVMYAYTNDRQVPSVGNLFASALIQPPTNKLYFEDGSLSPGRNFGYSNPLYAISTYMPKNTSNDLTIVGGGQWDILPGLTFNPQFSLYQSTADARNFQKAYFDGPTNFNTTRTASGSYSKLLSPQASAVLTYAKSFNEVHNLELKAGVSYYQTDVSGLSASGNKAATDLIPTLNASAVPVSVSGSETHQRILGYFSRATYNYKQKYLVNASLRYDGASNLGTNNKWGFFPGISAGWRVDKENFWQALPENLLQLKLRGSYGVNGNINGLGLYQAQGEYSTTSQYDGNAAIQISTLPNPDLRWEQSKTIDFGMDIGLFDNRIGIMLDYYRRVTDNLLTTLSMPPTTGFSSILTNYGSLENKGFELELSANILPPSSGVQWNVTFNTATVNTKILKLPPNGIKNNRIGGLLVWDPDTKTYDYKGGLQEGGRIGDLYGYRQLSIYATDEEAAAGPVDMLIPRDDKTKYGGDVNWYDADKNDTIDTRDEVYMGNGYPRVTGGFSNTLSYKNISLYVRMDYTLGATVYYETGARLEGQFSGANALSSDILRSWKQQGDVTDVPRYYWADQNAQWNVWNARGNSRFYQKTDFLCLREVTLSYGLPSTLLKKINIADLRFHVTGTNLHYFTDYQGLNPEEITTPVAYPNPMSVVLGASITF